jgi:hypothetical protein
MEQFCSECPCFLMFFSKRYHVSAFTIIHSRIGPASHLRLKCIELLRGLYSLHSEEKNLSQWAGNTSISAGKGTGNLCVLMASTTEYMLQNDVCICWLFVVFESGKEMS